MLVIYVEFIHLRGSWKRNSSCTIQEQFYTKSCKDS